MITQEHYKSLKNAFDSTPNNPLLIICNDTDFLLNKALHKYGIINFKVIKRSDIFSEDSYVKYVYSDLKVKKMLYTEFKNQHKNIKIYDFELQQFIGE